MRRRKLAALWIISRTKIIIENIEMDTLRSLDLGLIQINSKEKSGTAPEKIFCCCCGEGEAASHDPEQ